MDASRHYILDGKKVVPTDFVTWSNWFETADRVIALTETSKGTVSTVFLGLDHGWGSGGPPLVFETMVFGGKHDQEYQTRCSTYEEAEQMHKDALVFLEDNG